VVKAEYFISQFGYVFLVIATSLKNFFFFISLEKVVYIKFSIGKQKTPE
jgi:hypothetical protein